MAPKKNKTKSIELSREAPSERMQITNKDLAVMKVMAQKQIEILTAPTPAYAIKSRPGGGGKTLRYVSHGYVTDQLNKAFGFDWDYKLLPVFEGSIVKHTTVKQGENSKGQDIVTHHIAIYGELTVRIHNPTKPAEIIATITKPGPGSALWHPANEWGDALKAAKSDGLKVAAHELGIALDLYWDDRAEWEQFEKKQNGTDEVVDALSNDEKKVPETVTELITMANQMHGAVLADLKQILGDNFMQKFDPKQWEKLEKHYGKEKK